MDDKEAAEKFAGLQNEQKSHAAGIAKTAASLKQIRAQLAAAAKDADALEVEAVARAIEALIGSIESRLGTLTLMVQDLRELEANRSFIVAHVAELRTLVHQVSELRKELMQQLDGAKKLAAQAKERADALSDSADDALRELAEIESGMSSFKGLDNRVKNSQQLLESATMLAQSRDRQLLESQQRDAARASVKGWYATLQKLEDRVTAALQKSRAKKLDDAVMKKIAHEADELLATAKTARGQMDAIEANLAKVEALDIPDVDVAKAARSLHISDRTQIAELGKALDGDLRAAEKALDALGAKLTPRQKGKAMIAQLRKDKVL